MYTAVLHQWLNEYCPLKRQLSLACRLNTNYASGPKSAPKSDSIWVRWIFNACVRIFCAPNARILLVYVSAKIKMSFIWKDDFFSLPKSAFSVRRSVAIFPSFVQAQTQPYSFGERIKLIICQTRHDLSVTIHEISIS